jgi:uncharacterized protein (DUF1501 family)
MQLRREFLKGIGGGVLAASLPGISFARAETESRLVVMIMRGAVDGLAMLAPYGEPAYAGLRGELSLASPGVDGGLLKLDGLFGLHPSFTNLYELYQKRQLIPIHAVATPYRERSHFDAQNLLENGTSKPGSTRDGWLNRALEPLHGSTGRETAIAMSPNTPLILRGNQAVTSWSPSSLPDADEETLRRIKSLYADDEFFSTRLQQALDSQDIAGDIMGSYKRRNRLKQTTEMMQATARFLRAPNGPRIAVIESSGWDTHANQGAGSGSLANKFKDLDSSLNAFRQAMGDDWSSTVVAVVTEFGRTVKVNGTRGTDHGTAAAAMLMGGAVNGGRVIADWPGLQKSALFQGRDLQPTMDLRSVFKGVLADHMDISPVYLDSKVFPESKSAVATADLIVSA